jgi:hypothetical protein
MEDVYKIGLQTNYQSCPLLLLSAHSNETFLVKTVQVHSNKYENEYSLIAFFAILDKLMILEITFLSKINRTL